MIIEHALQSNSVTHLTKVILWLILDYDLEQAEHDLADALELLRANNRIELTEEHFNDED